MWLDFSAGQPYLHLTSFNTTIQQEKKYKCESIISVSSSDKKPISNNNYSFCFILELQKRSFTFFCRTQQERQLWIYVFEVIVAMNAAQIPIAKYNPFDVENLAYSIIKASQYDKNELSHERVEEIKNELSHNYMHGGQMMDMRNCNFKELHINFNNSSFLQNATVAQDKQLTQICKNEISAELIDRTQEFGQQKQLNFLLNEILNTIKLPFQSVSLSSIDFKRERISGQILKVIGNRNFYHINATHERKLILDLGVNPLLTISRKVGNQDFISKIKRFQIYQIIQVDGYEQQKLRSRIKEHHEEKKERSRSTSMLKRFIKENIEDTNLVDLLSSKNNFGIEIKFQQDQNLMFFLKSQIEYSLWMKAFKLIEEMNRRKIPVILVNPFDYENIVLLHEQKANESKMQNLQKHGQDSILAHMLQDQKIGIQPEVECASIKQDSRQTHRKNESPSQTIISGNNGKLLNLQNCNADKIVISFGSPQPQKTFEQTEQTQISQIIEPQVITVFQEPQKKQIISKINEHSTTEYAQPETQQSESKKTFRRKVRLQKKNTHESAEGNNDKSTTYFESSTIMLQNVKPSPISKNLELQKSLIQIREKVEAQKQQQKKNEGNQFEQLFEQANTPLFHVNQIIGTKNDQYLKLNEQKRKEFQNSFKQQKIQEHQVIDGQVKDYPPYQNLSQEQILDQNCMPSQNKKRQDQTEIANPISSEYQKITLNQSNNKKLKSTISASCLTNAQMNFYQDTQNKIEGSIAPISTKVVSSCTYIQTVQSPQEVEAKAAKSTRMVRSSTTTGFHHPPSSIEDVLQKHRDTSFIENLISNNNSKESIIQSRVKTSLKKPAITVRIAPKIKKELVNREYVDRNSYFQNSIDIVDSWAEEAVQIQKQRPKVNLKQSPKLEQANIKDNVNDICVENFDEDVWD